MLKLALRNVFRHRLRTAMTLAAIVFGVTGLMLSGGFVEDVYEQLGEALIHSQSGHLQVSLQGFHAEGSRSPERYLITEPDRLKALLRKQAGVADVMARISFSGLLSNGSSDLPIIGEGIEPEPEARLGNQLKMTAGRPLKDSDSNGILIGHGLAQAMKLRPGDRVTLLLNAAGGALNNLEFDVVGVFQSFSAEFDARAVRISLSAAQELLAIQGANTLVLSLTKTATTESLASDLRAQFGSSNASSSGPRYEVLTWRQLNDFYESTVALYQRQFGVLQLIILVLVVLSVANSVNMSALERTGEFGTMMALGNRPRLVFHLLTVENILLGIIGGGIGVLLGLVAGLLISAIGIPMPPPPNANIGYTAHIRIVPWTILTAFLVGFCGTAVAALLPAWRVSRVQVVEALRQNI